MKYRLKEITPEEMTCLVGLCPAIYEVQELTPKEMQCGIAACPAIFEQNKDNYLIIGRIIDAKQTGLEGKVGKGEVLIQVPKKLIDDRRKV